MLLILRRDDRCQWLHKHTGKDPQGAKHFRMFLHREGRLRRSQGESGNGAVIPPSLNPELPFHIRNDIFCQFPVKIPWIKNRILSWQKCITADHDYDHLFTLSVRDQVIHDKIQFALPDPPGLILSNAMQKIEYRIALSGILLFLIARRCVHVTFFEMTIHT